MKNYRISISVSGYADILASSEEEALKKIKTFSANDFNWEDVNSEVLEDAVVISEDELDDESEE